MATGRTPFYEQQTTIGHVPGTPRAPVDDGLGRALGDVGAIGFGIAAEEARRADQEQRTMRQAEDTRAGAAAHVALSQAAVQFATIRRDLEDGSLDKDPTGHAGEVLAKVDELGDKLLADTNNEHAQSIMRTGMAAFRAREFGDAINFERRQIAKYRGQQADSATEQYAPLVAGDETLYPVVLGAMRDMVDNYLPPEIREAYRDRTRKALRIATVNGYRLRHPAATLEATSKALGMPADEGQELAPQVPRVVGADEPDRVRRDFQAADSGALYAAVMQQESGGRRFGADGNLLQGSVTRSGERAQGEMQVMPATARDPGFGVMAARDGSPDELARVGRDYLDAMVREFGGDRTKALAAYNAGPGRVQAAVKAHGDDWLAHMPDETKAYVDMVATRVAYPDPVKVAAADAGTKSDAGAGLYPADQVPEVPKGRQPTGLPFIDDLAPDELLQVRHQALAEVNQQRAEMRGDIERRMQEAEAMAANGKVDPNPVMSFEAKVAFGPVDGSRRFYEYTQTQGLARLVSTFESMPTPTIAANVRAMEPAAGPGYLPAKRRQEAAARAMDAVIKAREKDAALYVGTKTSTVQPKFNAVFAPVAGGFPRFMDPSVPLETRREEFAAYSAATLAEQQRLGIVSQSILPDAVKASIAKLAQATAGSGDSMASSIRMLSDTTGAQWPQVYQEIVASEHGKSLPDSFIVIPGVTSAAGREEVARLDGEKLDNLKARAEAVRPGAGKEVDQRVASELAPFFQTMLPNAQNGTTGEAMLRAGKKLAYARVAGGGDPKEAARQAAGVLVGHLDFSSAGSIRAYAVPKAENPILVQRGATAALGRIERWNLQTPEDLSASRTPGELNFTWAQRVLARPMWVTKGDEKGLLLYTIGENGQPAAVRWADGSQVSFEWQGLREWGAEATSMTETYMTSGERVPGAFGFTRTPEQQAEYDTRLKRERKGR